MQLTCPECGARYEVDEGLIPPEGRRVQCSACDHVWQQPGPDAGPAEQPQTHALTPKPAQEAARDGGQPANEPGPTAPPRPPLADEVRAILREEADRETRVRRERGLVEVQPDLGLAGLAARSRRRPAPGALPDPDKINETLRAASLRAAEMHGARRRERPARGGFLTGLLVGLCLVGLAALAYVGAQRIVAAIPEAEPAVEAYVAAVDDARVTLDRAAERAAAALSDLVESVQ